jgi:hypothetical protein
MDRVKDEDQYIDFMVRSLQMRARAYELHAGAAAVDPRRTDAQAAQDSARYLDLAAEYSELAKEFALQQPKKIVVVPAMGGLRAK